MAVHQGEARQALTDPEVGKLAPRLIYQYSVSLNCAFALFADNLFNSLTNYAEPYRATPYFSTGQQLYKRWQESMVDFKPGDEYDLVDAFADTLRLEGWYEWRQDEDKPAPAEREQDGMGPEGGPTNLEYLQQPEAQMAITMYMLGALKRFEGMHEREIMQIAGEIALIGNTGIDYTDTSKKHELRFLPGARFSGLHLLAIMYVGFQLVNPELDTGLPLAGAYADALQLYEAER
jgi:hypothetical protein